MKIFFVRHGHPDYTEPKALGYPGFGNDLAPLDPGREDSPDAAESIISRKKSPYFHENNRNT